MVQQAIHQELSLHYEPYFSESSFGFRPGRSAHMAIMQAAEYIKEGREWVVDIDLENFFDRINHDRLMQRLRKTVSDKRLLRLINQFLKAGMMDGGLVEQRTQGTPQGGPLSPLLSNIVLDELDRELEVRGHSFCRYADDCNIYVRTKKAGERVMESIVEFIETKLKLKVNRQKSGVRHCSDVKFLGYTVMKGGDNPKKQRNKVQRGNPGTKPPLKRMEELLPSCKRTAFETEGPGPVDKKKAEVLPAETMWKEIRHRKISSKPWM